MKEEKIETFKSIVVVIVGIAGVLSVLFGTLAIIDTYREGSKNKEDSYKRDIFYESFCVRMTDKAIGNKNKENCENIGGTYFFRCTASAYNRSIYLKESCKIKEMELYFN